MEIETNIRVTKGSKQKTILTDAQKGFLSAIKRDDVDLAKALLMSSPELAQTADEDGETVLHWAVAKDQAELVSLLFKCHANLDAQNGYDEDTPLHTAFKILAKRSAEILLQAPSKSLLLRNLIGDTPTQSLIFHSEHPEKRQGFIELCQTLQISVFENRVFAAAFYGHINLLTTFLDENKCLKIRDTNGYSPVLYAVANGQTNVIKLLTDHGATFDEANNSGYTALHIAAENGYKNLVKQLIESGANTEAKTHDGLTYKGLEEAYDANHSKEKEEYETDDETDFLLTVPDYPKQTMLPAAVEFFERKDLSKEQIDLFLTKIILKQDMNSLLWLPKNLDLRKKIYWQSIELTPLQIAVFFGGPKLKHIISGLRRLKGGFENITFERIYFGGVDNKNFAAQITLTDSTGFTLLHYAAANNQIEIAEFLITLKSDLVNQPSNLPNFPLHVAVINGYPDMVKLLLKRGANPEAKDYQGKMPSDLIRDINDPNLNHRLCEAFKTEATSYSKRLSFKLPATCMLNENEILLLESVRNKNWETFQACIQLHRENKLSFNIQDPNTRQTPLHIALAGDSIDEKIINFILEQKLDINAIDDEGNTPLHIIVIRRLDYWVQKLLDKGADPTLQNIFKQTPIELAKQLGHEKIVKILEVHCHQKFHQTQQMFPNQEPLRKKQKNDPPSETKFLNKNPR